MLRDGEEDDITARSSPIAGRDMDGNRPLSPLPWAAPRPMLITSYGAVM